MDNNVAVQSLLGDALPGALRRSGVLYLFFCEKPVLHVHHGWPFVHESRAFGHA